jgi:hypothetical protein
MTADLVARIIIVHEPELQCMSAGSPDLLDFVLFAPTREELEAMLPKALADHYGAPVRFRILTPKA